MRKTVIVLPTWGKSLSVVTAPSARVTALAESALSICIGFPTRTSGEVSPLFVFSGERQLPGACGEKEGRNEHEYRGKKVSLGKETLWSGCAQDIEYSGDCCYHKFVLVWVIVLYDSDNY